MSVIDLLVTLALILVLVVVLALVGMAAGSVRLGLIRRTLTRRAPNRELRDALTRTGPTSEIIRSFVSGGVSAGNFARLKSAVRFEVTSQLIASLVIPLMLLLLPFMYVYAPESAKSQPVPLPLIVAGIAGIPILALVLVKALADATFSFLALRQLDHQDGLAFADKLAQLRATRDVRRMVPFQEILSGWLLMWGIGLDKLERLISLTAMVAGLVVAGGLVAYLAGAK